MPQLTFTAPFSKNTGLIFSAQEIRISYLSGITLPPSLNGRINLNFSDEDIELQIRSAQQEIENYLNLKLIKQIYFENFHFINNEWVNWGYMKTTYPVAIPLRLLGKLNELVQTTFPSSWLSVKKESSGFLNHRTVYLVPNGNTGLATSTLIYAGLLPNFGYINASYIPNYWDINYVTGFDKIPADLITAIGQLTAISLLYIAGSSVLGLPGLSGTSLSIDGLSQSLTSSLNAFGARIKGYSDDFQRKLPMLQGTYRGFIWDAF